MKQPCPLNTNFGEIRPVAVNWVLSGSREPANSKFLHVKIASLILLSLFLTANIAFAQKTKSDVIYLKNGSIINGQIISALPAGQVKIKTKDNSLWVFESAQIDSISKSVSGLKQLHSGNFTIAEAGVLAGNSDNQYHAPFSFMIISGRQFGNRFSVGAGTGVEFFSETYLPVVADLRYYFNRQGVQPFLGIQGGYSFALDKPDEQFVYQTGGMWPQPSGTPLELEAKGGLLLNPSLGISTSLNQNLALTFSAGYRIMRHQYCREDNYSIDVDYNRLSLKIGLLFQ